MLKASMTSLAPTAAPTPSTRRMRQRPTLLVPILEMWRRLFKVAAQMLETEFQDVDVDVTLVGLSGFGR